MERKVYEGRREPFETIVQLQESIGEVWDSAIDLNTIRKSICQSVNLCCSEEKWWTN